MNEYLVALAGLVAILAVGFVCYGVIFKDGLKENHVEPAPGRLVASFIGMYVVALAFIMLYTWVDFGDMTGVAKGLYLGLWTGVPFFAIPFLMDAPYLKSKDTAVWAMAVNWVLSLLVLGLVVGLLMK